MRKLDKGRKFNRETGQRKALLRLLVAALFLHEKIKTTKAKAKEISPIAEKFITRAKKGDISSRKLLARDFSPMMVKKLVNEIAPRFKKRNGGYTRVIKLGPKKNSGKEMAIIELVK